MKTLMFMLVLTASIATQAQLQQRNIPSWSAVASHLVQASQVIDNELSEINVTTTERRNEFTSAFRTCTVVAEGKVTKGFVFLGDCYQPVEDPLAAVAAPVRTNGFRFLGDWYPDMPSDTTTPQAPTLYRGQFRFMGDVYNPAPAETISLPL